MTRMSLAVFIHLTLLCFSSLVPSVSARLPYSPSHILLSPRHNNSLVYLFLSDSSTHNKTEFLSLNISRNVDAANPQYRVLLGEAPFHGDGDDSAFLPVTDHQNGLLEVHAGDCRNSSSHGSVWRFEPDDNSPIGNGTWSRLPVKQTDHDLSNVIFPPTSLNYLAGGFAYAYTNSDPTSVYTFGGLCPLDSGSDGGIWKWISEFSADYSQSMSVLTPQKFSGNESSYGLQSVDNVGDAPGPMAGFSLTPLRPTYATTSSGSVWRKQSFLLLGGLSQNGSLNMSQISLFTLPQNSWDFIHVNATKGSAVIGSRSGHSAVLSPDGCKLIVFGGWVDNTSTPAEPLLAVLNIGKDYGGSGSWSWHVPPSNGSGLTDAAGIYGHGATMLPGGMMMIAGGYSIPPRNHTLKRSANLPNPNSNVYFYDVASNSWATSYVNPNSAKATPPPSNSSPASSSSKHSGSSLSAPRKAGLGVGIGVGISLVGAIALLYWLYAPRRRARRARDLTIRELALSAQRPQLWGEPSIESMMPKRRGASRWTTNRDNAEDPNWQDNADATAEKTNLLGGARSRGRSVDQHTDGNPDAQITDDQIHTIDEREEDTNMTDSLIPKTENADQESPKTQAAADRDSEEQSPLSFSHPQALFENTTETHLQDGKRSNSPRQNDRTTSELSESSNSAVSTNSNPSGRKATATCHRGPSTTTHSPSTDQQQQQQQQQQQLRRPSTGKSENLTTAEKNNSADTFATAHTRLSLQLGESEHLLGTPQDWHWQTPPESPSKAETGRTASTSNVKAKDRGLIGTVRRAFTNARKEYPAKRYLSAVHPAVGGTSNDDGSSPTASPSSSALPRRAISASAELDRRKQRAKDWGVGSNRNSSNNNNIREDAPELLFPHHTRFPRFMPRESRLQRLSELGGLSDINNNNNNNDNNSSNENDGEGDRDVEADASRLRVQTTFTVPKERLRVVNATARDMDDLSSAASSRNFSGHSGRDR